MTKQDADKALEHLDELQPAGLARDSVARFITEIRDQLPEAKGNSVADAAKAGFNTIYTDKEKK